MSVAYKIPETQISHNRFDDEIIAVNLATGSYFSFHNTAAELWSLLERGQEAQTPWLRRLQMLPYAQARKSPYFCNACTTKVC